MRTPPILIVALVAAFASPAFAATVTIDPAPYIDAVAAVITPLASAIALLLIRKLPGPLADYLVQVHADKLLVRALGYGANTVKNAGFAKPVTVDVANDWIASSLEYLDERAPAFMKKYGEAAIEKMLLARIPIAQADGVKIAPDGATDPKAQGFLDPRRA